AGRGEEVRGEGGGGGAGVGGGREVGAAAGQRVHGRHRVLGARVHGVGGAELLREGQGGVLDVHRHDRGGAGQARALQHVEADAAAADHRHAVAGLHAGVEHGGAHAGGDAAADQRQLGKVE